MALRYIARGDYKDIVDLHGVHKNQVYISLLEVAKAINKHYAHELIFSFSRYGGVREASIGILQEVRRRSLAALVVLMELLFPSRSRDGGK